MHFENKLYAMRPFEGFIQSIYFVHLSPSWSKCAVTFCDTGHYCGSIRGFLKNRHRCFELSHSEESSLRSLSTM